MRYLRRKLTQAERLADLPERERPNAAAKAVAPKVVPHVVPMAGRG